MIGQKVLLDRLNGYTLDSFPHSTLFVGEKGCGKHTLVNHIRDNILHLPVVDMTSFISDEYIDAVYRTSSLAIYLIDTCAIEEKQQNTILKFVEEPLKNAFVILLAESRNNLLDTIINRCVVFEFERYSRQELASFVESGGDVDLILSVIHTPGKIINTNLDNLEDMYDVCFKVIEKIGSATLANSLSITNKINFSDEYDKFDLDIFFDVLSYLLLEKYKECNDVDTYDKYLLTLETRKKLNINKAKKNHIVMNFLTKLWEVSKQ